MNKIPISFDFDENGVLIQARLLQDGNGGNGNGGISIPDFREIPNGVIWKQKGTTDHPMIWDGKIDLSVFVLGHFAHIEVKIHFGKDTYLGGNTDESAFWYFQLPAYLMPDFNDPKTKESVGSFHAYRSGNLMMDGSCYWTKNVGSGIDGIKLSANLRYDIGPRSSSWICKSTADGSPDGDSLRFSINYRRGSAET